MRSPTFVHWSLGNARVTCYQVIHIVKDPNWKVAVLAANQKVSLNLICHRDSLIDWYLTLHSLRLSKSLFYSSWHSISCTIRTWAGGNITRAYGGTPKHLNQGFLDWLYFTQPGPDVSKLYSCLLLNCPIRPCSAFSIRFVRSTCVSPVFQVPWNPGEKQVSIHTVWSSDGRTSLVLAVVQYWSPYQIQGGCIIVSQGLRLLQYRDDR
jgi:hypothetical protein